MQNISLSMPHLSNYEDDDDLTNRVIPELVRDGYSNDNTTIDQATLVIYKLARNESSIHIISNSEPLVITLLHLLINADSVDVRKRVSEVLSILSNNEDGLCTIYEARGINPLLEALSSSVQPVVYNSFATLQNLVIFHETAVEDAKSLANSKKQTLLHVAAGFGKMKLVTRLLRHGSDVNAQDSDGQAPLHNSACHGHYNVSRKLIEAGALVDLVDEQGWTPLHFALARKNNATKISPLYWKVVELLIEAGANPYHKSNSGKSCIRRIKDSENMREIRLLHLLHQIKSVSDTRKREELIDSYMKVDEFFELVRIGDNDLETLRLVVTPNLLRSILPAKEGITPLHRAAGYNHIESAKLFISMGAEVDATDSFGRIPLHNAAEYGHMDMIELLVESRSCINKQDHSGLSPLHKAAKNKTFTPCLKLIELGADPNLKCMEDKYPYDLAESDDVREVLRPRSMKTQLEVIPSSSDQAIYLGVASTETDTRETSLVNDSLSDPLMLDSTSDGRLFNNSKHNIKKITLDDSDWRYQSVKKMMIDSIRVHIDGGLYSTYEILSIELLLHETAWYKYRLECKKLEVNFGKKNERLLFHGSNFIDDIQSHGFNESYAQRDGMFGAAIYFAEHSSKSNQYTFGWGQGCKVHQNKSCYICERKMILAQVLLGKSLVSKEAMPNCAHAPPGYSSVTGSPSNTDNLTYPEYAIYVGDQAYPLFVITYRIKK